MIGRKLRNKLLNDKYTKINSTQPNALIVNSKKILSYKESSGGVGSTDDPHEISTQYQMYSVGGHKIKRCDHKGSKNCYFKLTQFTTKSPFKYLCPIIVYCAMAPIIYILFIDYKYSMDFTMYFPNDSSSVKAYNKMINNFPPAYIMPFYLLGITNNINNKSEEIWTQNFFNNFCYITDQIMDEFYIPSIHFHSAMYSPNITYNINNNYKNITNIKLQNNSIFCFDRKDTINGIKILYKNNSYINSSTQYYIYYEYLNTYLNTLISKTETASIINFIPSFNPLLQSAVKPSNNLLSN